MDALIVNCRIGKKQKKVKPLGYLVLIFLKARFYLISFATPTVLLKYKPFPRTKTKPLAFKLIKLSQLTQLFFTVIVNSVNLQLFEKISRCLCNFFRVSQIEMSVKVAKPFEIL